jgi:hypothetical protein
MSTDEKIDTYMAENPIEARPVMVRPEPSPRMRELDFLLGTVESVFDTGVRFRCTTKPILGGLHVRMEISATYADGSWRNDGIWTVGWSEVDQEFQSYYADALGNQGLSTSPGWKEDGTLEFVGSTVLAEVGVRGMTKDHYIPLEDGHFRLDAYVQSDGEWKRWNTQDCWRVEG